MGLSRQGCRRATVSRDFRKLLASHRAAARLDAVGTILLLRELDRYLVPVIPVASQRRFLTDETSEPGSRGSGFGCATE